MSSTGVGQKELTTKATKPYLHKIAILCVSEAYGQRRIPTKGAPLNRIGKVAYLPDAPPKTHHQRRIGKKAPPKTHRQNRTTKDA